MGSTGRGRREAEGGFGAKERLLLLDVGLTLFVVMWDETFGAELTAPETNYRGKNGKGMSVGTHQRVKSPKLGRKWNFFNQKG